MQPILSRIRVSSLAACDVVLSSGGGSSERGHARSRSEAIRCGRGLVVRPERSVGVFD